MHVIIQKRTDTINAVHIGISASQEDITRFAPLYLSNLSVINLISKTESLSKDRKVEK